MFGRYIWERYMLRVKVLEEWQRMLIEINGEINYSAQSMSQICRQMSKTSVYGKKFWDGIAKKTEERNAGLPGEFWREHLREYISLLHLHRQKARAEALVQSNVSSVI